MTDDRPVTREEIQKALFIQLVAMLATSTLQQLGKLVNPVTRKTEVDLEGAEATIDLLDMLEAKTRGNLDKDEERMMKDTLMSLKMNFVECSKAAPAGPAASEEKKPDIEAPKSDAKGGDSEPRFHKRYE